MDNYEIFKSLTTNNYIAIIYSGGYFEANKIKKEIKDKGFIITDDNCDILWLEKIESKKKIKLTDKYIYDVGLSDYEINNKR